MPHCTPDQQGEGQANEVVGGTHGRDGGNDQGGTGGLGKGAEQISTHTSNVTNVVTDIICAAHSASSASKLVACLEMPTNSQDGCETARKSQIMRTAGCAPCVGRLLK